MHKTKEHEAYLDLFAVIPNYFVLSHVKSHLDHFKASEDLSIPIK